MMWSKSPALLQIQDPYMLDYLQFDFLLHVQKHIHLFNIVKFSCTYLSSVVNMKLNRIMGSVYR